MVTDNKGRGSKGGGRDRRSTGMKEGKIRRVGRKEGEKQRKEGQGKGGKYLFERKKETRQEHTKKGG